MDRTPVTSSNITSIGFNPNTNVLEVEFKAGTVYHYNGVPAAVHAELMAAESVGKYLNAKIKPVYVTEKISG